VITIPFDSKYKKQTTVVKLSDTMVRVYTKGAPDVLYNPYVDKLDESKNRPVIITKVQVAAGEASWNDPA
jgi:magnesium-transporting ATPase (P-type)